MYQVIPYARDLTALHPQWASSLREAAYMGRDISRINGVHKTRVARAGVLYRGAYQRGVYHTEA